MLIESHRPEGRSRQSTRTRKRRPRPRKDDPRRELAIYPRLAAAPWPTGLQAALACSATDLPRADGPRAFRPYARERRTVDAVLQRPGEPPRIIEVDETQHFNCYRAITIRAYPRSAQVAFDRRGWLAACGAKRRLEGGGFGKPRPPLFPDDGGRHRQRAYRDALADLIPPVQGWLPTLRIAYFEVQGWIDTPQAQERMTELLAERL